MKFPVIVCVAAASFFSLAGCSGSMKPHSYCHKLATGINSYNHRGTNSLVNPAQKARMAQEYQALDCEDQ